MTRGPTAPASGFSSTGGGGGMSSTLGLLGPGGAWATLAGGGGRGAGWLFRSADPRQTTMATMASRRTAATIAYFALLPDVGTPAGGRLEGLVIRSGGSAVRRE